MKTLTMIPPMLTIYLKKQNITNTDKMPMALPAGFLSLSERGDYLAWLLFIPD